MRNDSIIKAWREYLGITQKELAVVKFEDAGARPRIATIRKIAAALGLDEKQLLAGRDGN